MYRAELLGCAAPNVPAKPPTCVIDFETYSECDLKECGGIVYAQHPSTEILCMSYRLPDMDHAEIWVPSRGPFPPRVLLHIELGGVLAAHNAGFDRAIWKYVLMPGKNLPPQPVPIPWAKRWKDIMAACACRALPLDLDELGSVLRLRTRKDKRGKELIRLLCKPQKPTKKRPERRRRDPDLLEELYRYCCTDSDSEWEVDQTIGDLPTDEYRIWILDQKINARGVYVDTDAVHAALKIVELVEEKLNEELRTLTNGVVTSGNALPAMKEWLSLEGHPVDDLTADTLVKLLTRSKNNHLPPHVKRVLQIRKTLAHASTKKLHKYLSCIAEGGRIQGLLQYHGASTGRWSGRMLQPQNFPRGDEGVLKHGVELLIDIIKGGDPDLLELIYGDPMDAIASALRAFIIAEPGKQFYVADFSAIEACVTAWLFDEDWKVEAFREIAAGRKYKGNEDMYCAAAAQIFGHVVSKKEHPEKRQDGKRCELAFGYQGGVGAWRRFDTREEDDEGYKTDEQVDEIKTKWRDAHPNIRAGWWGLQNAAISAVLDGQIHYYAKVAYEVVEDKAGKWLTCILPNGRRLWYFNPEVEQWVGNDDQMKYTLTYEGKDNKRGGIWARLSSYGGMLTENVVQAISRDLMVEAMIRVESAGYTIVLTVHDEIVAEVDLCFGSWEEFVTLMKMVPVWAEGCPINAAGWVGTRYHKE